MEKSPHEIINEKLARIQGTESKIHDYKNVYSAIEEGYLSKLTKNSFFGFLKVILYLLALLCLIIAFVTIGIDEELLNEPVSRTEAFWTFIIYAIFLFIVGKIVKSNIAKRNVIFELSKLMEDVIGYMESSLQEDKKRYEHFVDEHMDKSKMDEKLNPINK
jgi:hypothetical protein